MRPPAPPRTFAPALLLAALLAAAALTAGCGMSEEEARQKLADLNVEYSEDTFVEHAVEGDQTVVDLFLKAGMNPDTQGEAQFSVEDVMGDWKTDQEDFEGAMERFVQDTGGTVSLQRATPLSIAAVRAQEEMVRRLLKAGANPANKATLKGAGNEDINGITPLHCAAFSGAANAANALLEAGSDPNQAVSINMGGRRSIDFTPLVIAGSRGNAEVIRGLLEAGGELQMDSEGIDGRLDGRMALSLQLALLPVSEDQGYRDDRVEAIRVLLEAGALNAGAVSEDEYKDASNGPFGWADIDAPGVQEVMRLMREAAARG